MQGFTIAPRRWVRAGMLALALTGAPLFGGSTFGATWAQDAAMSREELRAFVLDTIRENPEIIAEAIQILQQRQQDQQDALKQQVLSEQGELLRGDPNAPVLGNPEGDVTIVEFSDYNCPYCKRSAPELAALMEADGNIRLVMREWPILAPGSEVAARAALAARKQGRYADMHDALMALRGKVDEAGVMKVARELGLDMERLRADMQAPEVDAHLSLTSNLARALGLTGTPGFVIGDEVIPGFIDRDQMAELVARARDGG